MISQHTQERISAVCKRCGVILDGRPDVLTVTCADDGLDRRFSLCRECVVAIIDVLNSAALSAAGV